MVSHTGDRAEARPPGCGATPADSCSHPAPCVRAAECTSLRQLRGEHRFVRHEMLKAQNSLVMMVLKMCGTGIFVRKHAVSSPQVRVLTANPTFI